jgi:hypothetical protein
MAHTRLSLYNIALRAVGERRLAAIATTDIPESQRLLDEVWSSGSGAVRACLEQGYWHFAMRAIQLDSDSSVSVAFGFTYAFAKPVDLVKLDMVSGDPAFAVPLRRYEQERDYFYTEVDPLYLRYVSDDTDFGNDLSQWTEVFAQYVGHWMAVQIAPTLTSDIDMERLEGRAMRLLKDAKSHDAQIGPTREFPLGRWAQSRFGTRNSWRDGGPRNRLTS